MRLDFAGSGRAVEVAAARRAGAPDWLNLRTTLGLLLFLISLVSGSVVLRSAQTGTHLWAAVRDLPEGATLQAGDLERVPVHLPASQLSLYLGSSVAADGLTLLRPLRRGELLSAGWVTDDQAARSARSIAVPVSSAHAVGGALRPGDLVDVLATVRAVDAIPKTTVLVKTAEVEAVLRTEGMVMEGDTFAGITLSVAPEEAAKIAFALRIAEIDLVRVEGAPMATDVTSIGADDL